MNTLKPLITLFISTVLLFLQSFAQETPSDFFDQIKNHDLSTILSTDSIIIEDRENGYEKIKRAEILGFIGDDYQRFFIHFISVIQNPTNPYEYLVFGKTKVKETICSFHGTITIKQANIYNSGDFPTYKQGSASCEVLLYEDKKEPSTGVFKGKLNSHFIMDSKETFRYDALMFIADGFSNNQFVGSWTSYKTNRSKKCHWGDYRIPDCGDLDIGAGEFGVNDLYLKNGWENYRLASNHYSENEATQKTKQKESEAWWK